MNSASATIARPFSRRDAVLLALLAMTLRLAHLFVSRGDPVFDVPMLDAEYLVNWARSIASGDLFGSPEGTAYFRTPLYPMFLAALFRLPGDDLFTARLGQVILGSATAVLLARITARRFGRLAAWGAGLLAATAWPLLHYGRELLISALAVFLVTLFLSVWDGATPSSRAGRWFLVGALAALAALAWPSLAILAPVAIAGAALESAPSLDARLRRALFVLLGFALLVVPVALRNHAKSGEWVPLASQGGLNFWIGNNPDADGMSARLPGYSSWRNEDVDAALAREFGRKVGPREQDRYFRGKAFAFLRERPADGARLFAKKIYYFLQGYEIRNDRDLDSLRAKSPILRLPLPDFGWILPLAVTGLVFGRRAGGKARFGATAAAIAVAVVLFFVCARYRLPAWPPLLVLAGAGIAAILERGPGAPSPAARAARLAFFAAIVVLARIDFLHIRRPDPSQPHFQYGNVYARVARFDDAEREYREALALSPNFGEAHFHLGALLLERGRLPEAIAELQEGVRLLPESFRAKRSLADALDAAGDVEGALALRDEIVTMSAGDPEDAHALARALGRVGRYEEAWALFSRRLAEDNAARRESDPWLLLNAGQTALKIGREKEGLELLRRAESPETTRDAALEATALYYLATRRWNEALGLLSDAILRSPENLRLVKLRAAARYTTGDATGAVEDLEHVLARDPQDEEAQSRLDEIRGRVSEPLPGETGS